MKKLIPLGIINNAPSKIYLLFLLITSVLISCQPEESELGRDILPSGDNIFVFYDTLNDIQSYPARGKPFITSENFANPQYGRLFLLGNVKDSISGFSKADIITQFNPTLSFDYGPNMVVDSLILYLYFESSDIKNIAKANVKVYELTERIYMDSVYYSNYDVTGKYNPVPLAEKQIVPSDTTVVELLIEDQAFINKFIYPLTDTLFRYDSLFKDYFNGLYITTDEFTDGGFLSKIHLANTETKLSIKYANDSTALDTIVGYNYKWTNFTINEYSSQKVNIYQHDFTGTTFENILDDPESDSPVLYVQGMNGVNTKLHFGNVEHWYDSGLIAINSAYLEFELLPDSISGIDLESVPDRLILLTDMGDYSERLNDFVLDPTKFDGTLRAVSEGVFFDTTYIYRFNIGLHYQGLINGDIENRDLILQPYDNRTNNKFVKLWSNYYRNKGSLRLKVIYTKLE